MDKKILVIGSSNTDMVVQSDHLPAPGETVLGNRFIMNPGGKGANQAVAASRLGGNVFFVAKIGTDIFGADALQGFKKEGIDTNYIIRDEKNPSGIALIMVDSLGENCISVALGSNAAMTPAEIETLREVVQNADILIIQLETPLETVEKAIDIADEYDLITILNPAPAQELPDRILSKIKIITPNETEASLLSGIKVSDLSSAKQAALKLREMGVETVIITMGSSGAYVLSDGMDKLIPSKRVDAIDATAAGDTFNGALAVGLAEGMQLEEAIKFANLSASITVTRSGAQSSLPFRSELNI